MKKKYPRDLIGYGSKKIKVKWPRNAKLALQFVLNYEEGSENSVLHGDKYSETFLSEIIGAKPIKGRHLNMESIYEYGHDMNTEYIYHALDHDPPSMKRKVIRGGSWKDIGYYLQTGSRSYEYQDTAKSYIGFRSVMNYLGRGGPNKEGDF